MDGGRPGDTQSHARRKVASAACGMVVLAFAWASSGVLPVRAQSNGVPDQETLEEALKKKPVTPKASPNPAGAKKAAEAPNASPQAPKPAHRGTLIPMVVVSDAACALEVNGDSVAVLEPGVVKKMSVWPGDQLVKCASTDEPGETYSAVQTIKAGEQSVVQIVLAPRVDAARQKREAQAQSSSAEDEAWAQASQDGTAASLRAYMDKYPEGRYGDQAKGLLTEATQRAEEDADWKRAGKSTQTTIVQSFVDKYPTGHYLEAAQRRMEFIKQLPPRAVLPFSIDEDAWETLENSAFYRDLPRRTHKITVQVSSEVLGEPNNGSSANFRQATVKEISPIGDRCVLLHSITRKSEPSNAAAQVTDDYQCGLLKLETVSDGKLIAAVSASDVESFVETDKTLREKPPCEIPSSGAASAFHAALTGTATRLGCSSGEYFFEDLNVWLYELGEMDPQKQQYVVPATGYHFESVANGDPGSKVVTTYDTFSWTDSN
ncbi:MAG TPA: hypothetical protein VNW26_01055 [Steroidobacteraceae bacterium]|nr:hypothetical protein [Steroidobacteraceae bacterium]